MTSQRLFKLFALIAALLAVGFAGQPTASAQNFRVESKVYEGSAKEPSVKTLTLFNGDVIYDILNGNDEVTVYDVKRGSFDVLCPAKKVRTKIDAETAGTLVEALRHRADAQKSSFLRFMANPNFEEKFDAESGRMTLDGPFITYEVQCAKYNQETADSYKYFTDWSAMINTLLNAGSRLPYARMNLNSALAKKSLLPKEVNLTLRTTKNIFARPLTARSEHVLTVGLTVEDRKRIESIGRDLTNFKEVDWNEYRKQTSRSEE